MNVIQTISREYEANPGAFGGALILEDIEQAEKALGVTLPMFFQTFLLMFGSGSFNDNGTVIYGLKSAESVDIPSFVDETVRFRSRLPESYDSFVVIAMDRSENPIGFHSPYDKVVVYDFDASGEVVLAPSLESYLRKVVMGRL